MSHIRQDVRVFGHRGMARGVDNAGLGILDEPSAVTGAGSEGGYNL
ncbi:hypothetical protein KAURM247S_04276 [Kitasatospora aureofaciens]